MSDLQCDERFVISNYNLSGVSTLTL